MRKISSLICLLLLTILLSFSSINIVYANSDDKIYLGGMPAGFTLSTRGAHVVGVLDVITENGIISPAKDAGVCVGDVILNIDGYPINNAKDIEVSIKGKDEVTLDVERNCDKLKIDVKTAKDVNGCNKIGVFIKDNVSGIGTITYIKGDRFASLGHPVIADNGEIINIVGGSVYNCKITGSVKGERGKAGELKGVFIRSNCFATIDKNLDCGVYGNLNENFNCSKLTQVEIGEASVGEASIFSTIDGDSPNEFKISIVKIDNFSDTKNFVIKVDDEDLLSTTGGIVQGMSGSPIMQNGKLVGAVTHVFINDPTRGFGISIKNMINN